MFGSGFALYTALLILGLTKLFLLHIKASKRSSRKGRLEGGASPRYSPGSAAGPGAGAAAHRGLPGDVARLGAIPGGDIPGGTRTPTPPRPPGSHLRARPRAPAAVQPQHAPHGRRHHRGAPPSRWRAGPGAGPRLRAALPAEPEGLGLGGLVPGVAPRRLGVSEVRHCRRVAGYTWSCSHGGHQVSRTPPHPGAASCLGRTALKAGLLYEHAALGLARCLRRQHCCGDL